MLLTFFYVLNRCVISQKPKYLHTCNKFLDRSINTFFISEFQKFNKISLLNLITTLSNVYINVTNYWHL
jgi:hypothetical protein